MTHHIKPSAGPEVLISTPDQVVSDYEEFIGTSFHIAKLLDQ